MGDERGVVAVIVALMLTAMVGMAALVVDLGLLYVVRGELQNSADSGALAGAVELATNGNNVAKTVGLAYATRPGNFHLTQPPPGQGAVAVSFPKTDQVRVQVGPITVPTIFASVLGVGTADVTAVAVARLERRIIGSGPGNLMPFGINRNLLGGDGDGDDDDDDDDDGDHHDGDDDDGDHDGGDHHDGDHGGISESDIGTTVDIYPHPTSPGNAGLLDLDGGSNSNSDTQSWIENGFDDIFVIPESTGFVNVSGDPGISGNSLSGAISSRIGDRVLFPVFDQTTGVGSNTTFRVVDLVGGIIQSVQLTGPDSGRHITVQIVEFSSSDLIVGTSQNTPNNNSLSTPVLIQ